MSVISYNKNLAILYVKAIELNLRKSHLNRRKSLQKLLLLLQKLLLLLQKQRIRRRKMLQSYRLFSILLLTTCSLGANLQIADYSCQFISSEAKLVSQCRYISLYTNNNDLNHLVFPNSDFILSLQLLINWYGVDCSPFILISG